MAQSSKVRVEDRFSIGEKKLPLEDILKETYNSKIDTVFIRSLVDAVVKVTGTVTGNVYVFPRAGSEVEVDIRDKDEILNKKRGRACCGGSSGKSLFELV